MLLPFGTIAEYVCLFCAFRFLWNENDRQWALFKWFMLFTVAVETVGYINLVQNQSNHWLYNIYLPFEMGFKYFVLYRLCRPYFRVGPWIALFMAVFACLYAFEGIQSHFAKYSVQANSVGGLGIFIICCAYFYHFLKKDEYVNIYNHAPFWVITGLFFFYLGGTACNLFFNILAEIYMKQHVPVRYIIFTILNFILYGCWSYSFACRYRQRISSLS